MVQAKNFNANVLKFLHSQKQSTSMAQKIYFGNVQIMNVKTRERKIVEKQLFKEFDRPNDADFANKILRHLSPKERQYWEIIELCFDTARYLGDTLY